MLLYLNNGSIMSTPPQVTDKMQVIGHLDQYNLIIQYRKIQYRKIHYT